MGIKFEKWYPSVDFYCRQFLKGCRTGSYSKLKVVGVYYTDSNLYLLVCSRTMNCVPPDSDLAPYCPMAKRVLAVRRYKKEPPKLVGIPKKDLTDAVRLRSEIEITNFWAAYPKRLPS